MNKIAVRVPRICGIYGLETLLLRHPLDSLAGVESVEFDFSNLDGIALLPLSILLGWMVYLGKKNVNVSVVCLDRQQHQGLPQMLTRIHFARVLKSIGVSFIGEPLKYSGTGVAAFQCFSNLPQFEAYESSMGNADSVKNVVGGGDDIELISSGDFRNILLRELGDNAFLHGRGTSVRYGLVEYNAPLEPDSGGFLSYFDGQPYLEMIVSDSGPGLLDSLKNVLPERWMPDSSNDLQRLSTGARTCAFALEFSSTSDRDERKKRLSKIMQEGGDFIDVIPTGLYYVASVVRHYGGQLILRSKRTWVSFDYSMLGPPLIKENPLGKLGANVPGTHILIRVPRRRPTTNVATSKSSGIDSRSNNASPEVISLAKLWLQSEGRREEFVIQFEQLVERTFGKRNREPRRTLVILADGLSTDTKSLSLVLAWLGTIPHRGWAVFVGGLPLEYLGAVRAQSEYLRITIESQRKLRTVHRFSTWQSYTVTISDLSESISLGGGLNPADLLVFSRSLYLDALRVALEEQLSRQPVKHIEKANRYYLIQEGKYYTKNFYEVGQLVSERNNPVGAALSLSYIQQLVRTENISSIINLAPPLIEFSTRLARDMPNVDLVATPPANFPAVMKAIQHHKKNGRLLLLTDVICTGTQFRRYFNALRDADSARIVAFVDGREGGKHYMTVEAHDRAHTVSVFSPHRTEIRSYKDLRRDKDFEILLVDRKTHVPTPPDDVGELVLDPLDLIDLAVTRSQALLHGHIIYANNHFVDFLHFPRLFNAMDVELDKFWSRTLARLSEEQIDADQVSVFYLNEGRGWESLIPQILSTKRVAEVRKITREDIETPRVAGETTIKGQCIWFVLPAIASGETVRRCLQFATTIRTVQTVSEDVAVNLRTIISIIVGRMTPQELSFYQNITGYKSSKVQIEVLSFLPLPAYKSENECPMCVTLNAALSNASRFSDYSYLHNLFERARRELEPLQLKNSAIDEISDYPVRATDWRDFGKMRALFELGQRDIYQRKRLASMLRTKEARFLFVRMVGAHCDAKLFTAQRVRDALYDTFDLLQEDVTTTLRSDPIPDLPLSFFLGVHILFPELLEIELKWICSQACATNNLCVLSRLIFLSLLDAERYGRQLAVGADIAAHQGGGFDVVTQIQSYPFWFGAENGRSIAAFEQLVWLLRRSTSWGSAGLEEMRSWLTSDDRTDEQYANRARVFELRSVAPLLLNVATLRAGVNGNELWNAIESEGGKPGAQVAKIVSAVTELRNVAISVEKGKKEEFLRIVEHLDQIGGALAGDLERVYANVQDAVSNVRQSVCGGNRWPHLNSEVVEIKFLVAEDQPGILFSVTDLTASLCAFLENASEFFKAASPESPLVERSFIDFRFSGLDSEGAAVLEIHDNIPYKNPFKPSGGLKQVEKYCNAYGARATFDLHDDSAPTLKAKLYFRVDDSRRK